jgi:putative SOS response-associated peptidase YedK
MCGRYVSPEQAAIERQWHIGPGNSNPFAARYNVAPQQGNPANSVPVVRQAEDGELELVRLQWWLLPFWSKEPRIKYSTFNARVETVVKAASFREPLKRRRCIIPALGWYEWQELPPGKLPWFLHGAKGEILAFAGLWDRWEREAEVIESCSIIVGPANKSFEKIHDRMPFVLSSDRAEQWLDRRLTDAGKAMELLQPNPDDAIAFHRVGIRVSNARNQGPELIAPV